jgi:predicted N-acetyltransferase YhbS
MTIVHEQPHHGLGIDTLLDISFGPHRLAKTAYRLREGTDPVAELSLVALDDATGALDGTIRFWPILVGGCLPTLLLGPVAVAPHRRSEGLGGALIRLGIARARGLGWESVVLVGDAPYYGRFGFSRSLTLDMAMPGPVDLDRLLGLELVPGALRGAAGVLGRWPAGRALPQGVTGPEAGDAAFDETMPALATSA